MISFSFSLKAQGVLLDEGIQVEGLWCFPIQGEEHEYRYLPTEVKLALDQDSLPQFSFLRYVLANKTTETIETISQATGGGILHFLVLYNTPKAQVEKASIALKTLTENEHTKLVGPITFDKGRYNLISSILQGNGHKKMNFIDSGEAPIYENNRIALSFSLNPIQSKILLESFKMSTPDISLMFELSFSGYSHAYEAEIEVDWEKIQQSETFGGGASLYYISADVEKGLAELRRNGAITLNTFGENEHLEGLVQTAYQRLTHLLFQPIEIKDTPSKEKKGLVEAIGGLLGKGLDSRKITGFGLGVAYQKKALVQSGKATLTFNGRTEAQRNHLLTFNIGSLFREYGKNEAIFKELSLDDPVFQQRTLHVGIDGNLEQELGEMVNHITLIVRKIHGDSQTVTLKELSITPDVTKDSLGKIRLYYLKHNDTIPLDWLKYEYKTIWQFDGGGTYETAWQTQSASMINLYVPFNRRTIYLEAASKELEALGVRGIYIDINYPFFDKQKEAWKLIRNLDQMGNQYFQITLPNGQRVIDYSITWLLKNGTLIHKTGQDGFGLLFLDQFPTIDNN